MTKNQLKAIETFAKDPHGCASISSCHSCGLSGGKPDSGFRECMFYDKAQNVSLNDITHTRREQVESIIHAQCKKVYALHVIKELLSE